ncbi:MAG: peptidylprolyl isomerase, partial [Lentisphaeria bacterium]
LIRSNIIANIVEFEQSAYESSECPTSRNGGRLGWIKDGQEGFPKAFVDVALSLDVNEISQIIHTDYGYHILKCYEVK